ncbi:MAG TPA: hypothetical protein VGH20_09025 [Myxococcales bacterium]|jgi:hypothetical protein
MTRQKDLKRRVRARQEKTGESYTAALSNIRRDVHIPQAPSATAEARAAGLRCEAVVTEELRRMGDLEPLFIRLRELLLALAAEACGPLIRGDALALQMPSMKDAVEARRFLEAVRAGERGLSRNGRMVAFNWRDRVVVADLGLAGARKPLLQLGVLGEGPLWPMELLLTGVGR